MTIIKFIYLYLEVKKVIIDKISRELNTFIYYLISYRYFLELLYVYLKVYSSELSSILTINPYSKY